MYSISRIFPRIYKTKRKDTFLTSDSIFIILCEAWMISWLKPITVNISNDSDSILYPYLLVNDTVHLSGRCLPKQINYLRIGYFSVKWYYYYLCNNVFINMFFQLLISFCLFFSQQKYQISFVLLRMATLAWNTKTNASAEDQLKLSIFYQSNNDNEMDDRKKQKKYLWRPHCSF